MSISSEEFYKELSKLIKIPDNCRKLEIHMEYGEAVLLKAYESWAEFNENDGLAVKTYNLVECKETVLVGENNGFKEFRLKRDDE